MKRDEIEREFSIGRGGSTNKRAPTANIQSPMITATLRNVVSMDNGGAGISVENASVDIDGAVLKGNKQGAIVAKNAVIRARDIEAE
jgi:hypothetical protein